MIYNLFPIPIGRYELGRDVSVKELSFIKNQSVRSNEGNKTSTCSSLLENKELTLIRDFIETKISEYFTEVYKPKHLVNLKITQSWANYTTPGEFHHKHRHPNSFISGVFYMQSDPLKDRIYFYKDTYQQLFIPSAEFNEWNSESWWYDTKPGDLIIFPSSLSHLVDNVTSQHTRISLSFNTFPIGCVGDKFELTSVRFDEFDTEYGKSK
jgi:uncharacterized protein (TIGR02466 family)